MKTNKKTGCSQGSLPRRGLVLVLVLVILVVLAALTAALSLRVTQTRRRQQYMMDYQQARYACDSALKYMINVMPDKNFTLVSRQGMPDFSDLFAMDRSYYEAYIRYWLENASDEQIQKVLKSPQTEKEEIPEITLAEALSMLAEKIAHPNDFMMPGQDDSLQQTDPNRIQVPGPYGVPWPYVMEPVDLEMGSADVTIAIEDENAKMPLGWAVTNSKTQQGKEAQAALTTFCEWMGMDTSQIEDLQDQCETIREQKTFEIDPKPILLKSRASAAAARQAAARSRSSRFRTTRTTRAARASQNAAPAVKDELRPAIAHATDFGKLFHSSLLNTEELTYPRREIGKREEYPLRYLALWGSQEVNINTAPRHVLEAAFMFAGDPEEIASLIIERRQTKPFRSTKELEELLTEGPKRIQAAEPYITTQSSFFQIRVTSRCGNARCEAVATVFKDKKNVQTLAVLYGR